MNKRPRWTILNVDEKVIKTVLKYARANDIKVSTALKELVMNKRDERVQ